VLVLVFARRYDQAVEFLKKMVQVEPRFHAFHAQLGLVYGALGRLDEAITCLKSAISLLKLPVWTANLGYLYGLAGRKDDAVACLKELEGFSKPMYVAPLMFATVYYGLGDRERCQRALTEAFDERIGSLVFLELWPHFDAMRSDPFFRELCRKIGLP